MNIEKAMEFILDMQAKCEERWAKTDQLWARSDKRWTQVDELWAKSDQRWAKADVRWAKADVRFARSERRLDRIEGILAQTNHVVAGLARYGVSLRSDVRELQKFRARSEKWQAKTDENLAEITDKLNGLIDIVDKSLRRNGRAR